VPELICTVTVLPTYATIQYHATTNLARFRARTRAMVRVRVRLMVRVRVSH